MTNNRFFFLLLLARTQRDIGEAQLCPRAHRLHPGGRRFTLCSTLRTDVGQRITNRSKSHTTARTRALQKGGALDSVDTRVAAAVKRLKLGFATVAGGKLETVKYC